MTSAERLQALADLRVQLQECRLCLQAGYEIFPRAIYSGGIGARIMIIGQAPGITEKDAGRPFNAGSGTRLFQWLAEAGIEESWYRRTQYMSSVTKCYPGRSKSGNGDRAPSKTEQELCRPYLEQEINLVDPKLIIPVGRLSIMRFYSPKLTLAKIIGTQKQLDGRWVVPLPHPSGASRWHQLEENREKVRQAIGLIREHFSQIFPEMG